MLDSPSLARSWDLVAAASIAVAAAMAASLLPGGSVLRLVLTLPALFLVPGYLLVQTLARGRGSRSRRGFHMLLALGISPPLVGLLALATALWPSGFRAQGILWAVTLACLFLAAAAFLRRSTQPGGALGPVPASPPTP